MRVKLKESKGGEPKERKKDENGKGKGRRGARLVLAFDAL